MVDWVRSSYSRRIQPGRLFSRAGHRFHPNRYNKNCPPTKIIFGGIWFRPPGQPGRPKRFWHRIEAWPNLESMQHSGFNSLMQQVSRSRQAMPAGNRALWTII
jgi:hypothetical protein